MVKEKYADRITLCFGVELGMQPHLARRNAAFSKAHDYDFITPIQGLGSRIPLDRAEVLISMPFSISIRRCRICSKISRYFS